MNFVHHIQRVRHDPADGIYGDCYRTAIAMVLGVEPEDVPHFCDSEADAIWRERRDAWLARKGLCAIELPWGSNLDLVLEQASLTFAGAVVTISGMSPRGTLHECVIYRGKLYDPHPDGGGLVAPHDDGNYWMHIITRTAA